MIVKTYAELIKRKIEVEAIILEFKICKPYISSDLYWPKIQALESELCELKQDLNCEELSLLTSEDLITLLM